MNTQDIISKIIEARGFDELIPEERKDKTTPNGTELSVELRINDEPVQMTIGLRPIGKSYSGYESAGPGDRALYHYTGFSCSDVKAETCKINGEDIPLYTDRYTGKPCPGYNEDGYLTGIPTEFTKCLDISLDVLDMRQAFDDETMY